MKKGDLTGRVDADGEEIHIGDIIIYLKNTTDLKQYDNFSAEVRFDSNRNMVLTDSPFSNALRPLHIMDSKDIRIKERYNG
jgi:hypothetical protein